MTTSPTDPMDPVRLQLLLTGVREALAELPVRPAKAAPAPQFRRTADSPLFDGLAKAPESSVPVDVVSPPRLRPGGVGIRDSLDPTLPDPASPNPTSLNPTLLNPMSLAAVIQRSRRA